MSPALIFRDYRLASPLLGKKAGPMKDEDAILMLFKPIQSFVETITFDNGKEFTLHEVLAKELDCDTYFAKPYHSWEWGQNENANGLLRQYFPKAMELVNVTITENHGNGAGSEVMIFSPQ